MPLHAPDMPNVDRHELATILAALRLLQAAPALPPEIEEIATEQGDFERLDDEKIDALCERFDTAPKTPGTRPSRTSRTGRPTTPSSRPASTSLFEEIDR